MTRTLFGIFLLGVLAGASRGAETRFLDPAAITITELLVPPPAPDSAAAVADMDAVLKAQITRSDEEVARAKSELKLAPTAFQSVLGHDFTVENFPHTFALLEDAAQDSKVLSVKAKAIFGRPRPQFADSHVRPAVDGEEDPAYPSGHATRGMLWARILCEIVPQKKSALIARGQEIGWDRVVIGVHYPSDIYAGQVLGHAIVQAMRNNEQFQSRLADAKQEYKTFGAAHPIAATAAQQ